MLSSIAHQLLPTPRFARRGSPVVMAVGLLGIAFAPGAAAADDVVKSPADDEVWQVIYIQGQRVGYLHSRMWQTDDHGQTRIWSEAVTRMTIKRFGGGLSMTVTQLTEEDSDGNLLSFEFESDNPPISNSKTKGRVAGDVLQLTTEAAGKSTETSQSWDADVKSPVYQERVLEDDPVDAGETRTLKIFDPQFLRVAEVTILGLEPAETKLFDGTSRLLDRAAITHSLVPGLTTTVYSDTDGEALKTEMNLLGMVTYSVSREEALKEIVGEELDLAVNTLVKVDPIENAHRTQQIVYEMTLDRPQLTVDIAQGPTQSVERIDDQTYRITVTSLRPDDLDRLDGSDAGGPVGEEYLRPSRQLECEHPAVVKLAHAAAGELSDPVEIAVAMERYVHRNLKSKNFSTALGTAAEVAQKLEGDCTEHAVLLAAMLRVKQIPSRVVVGLVYVPPHSAFGGHMWTEAYLAGRWVPLDATLGQGGVGIGAGHLKFADTSLDDGAAAPVTAFLPLIGLLEHMHLHIVKAE